MHYGNAPHERSDDDMTILHCSCGWRSEELTREQLGDMGIPWYCGRCSAKNLKYITFHPRERDLARSIVGD